MAGPLSPNSVTERMIEALPTHEKDDPTSDISSSLDAVALFVHACMASLEFKLIGLKEDDPSSQSCVSLAPRLPSTWNTSLNSHSFLYSHPQSSMRFILRVDRLGTKTEVRGLALGDERIARFEITTRDYLTTSHLPIRIPVSENGTEQRDDHAFRTKLESLFTNPNRMTELATLVKTHIVQRLVPGLNKPGYEESPDDRAARQDADETARTGARPPPTFPNPLPNPAQPNPYPVPDNFVPRPGPPVPAGDFPPPGFEDEYEVNRPPRGSLPMPGFGPGGQSPFGIGGSDLYPAGLGPHDPLRGSFVPGRGGPGSGGMHPTFDDPLFQGPRGQGGSEFDPQIPPGARWDPLGPGGAPRFGGGRPGGRGNGGFGGFGGDII
ncbi:hypothetical protein OQA88_11061 [Cercophora sp. LCS_1]